jgi:hypothetical protein
VHIVRASLSPSSQASFTFFQRTHVGFEDYEGNFERREKMRIDKRTSYRSL